MRQPLAKLELEDMTDDVHGAAAPTELMRTILEASSTLCLSSASAQRAADEEVEKLVSNDPRAAERALGVLLAVRERLSRAVTITQMGERLAAAIVRAAEDLPDPGPEGAA